MKEGTECFQIEYFGALPPSAAAPKNFFRYYFVNSSTDEKSGTMLAECKWAAAAAPGDEP